MKLKLKNVFSLFLLLVTGFLLIGCSKIKTWPAESWDKVFIEYNAVFEKYPKIVYDTTNSSVNKKIDKTNVDNALWYKVFVIWKDKTLPKDLQNAIIWMKAWETKKITLKPEQITQTWYDKKNLKSEPWKIYEDAWITIKKWDIKYKNNQNVRVIAVLWRWDSKKILFDLNPLETYNNVVYTVKVLQVWWKELAQK